MLCHRVAGKPAKLVAQVTTRRATTERGGERRPRERTDRYLHNWAVRRISEAELGVSRCFLLIKVITRQL